jgi:hypothetical protein
MKEFRMTFFMLISLEKPSTVDAFKFYLHNIFTLKKAGLGDGFVGLILSAKNWCVSSAIW